MPLFPNTAPTYDGVLLVNKGPACSADPICGRTMQRNAAGDLQSPDYPYPYPNDLDCQWMVEVGERMVWAHTAAVD